MTSSKGMMTALRKLEYGVYVVTMGEKTEGNAFTASWISQVSSEPPMIILAINNKHQSSRILQENGTFVVNFIPHDQVAVAKSYYGPAESGYQKLKNSTIQDSPVTGTAMLNGAAGFLECRVVKRIPAGNHTLLLSDVVAGEVAQDTAILTTSSSKLHYAG